MPEDRRRAITCPKYEPVAGTRRCRHYHANGACGLPDEFMCVEWLKANAQAVPPPKPTTASEPARDLFGQLVVEKPASSVPTKAPRPSLPMAPTEPVPIVRTLADADIATFKALGLEVRLASDDLGEVWLVPAYTGKARQELSVEHASLLATICSALPGARVAAIVRGNAPVPS